MVNLIIDNFENMDIPPLFVTSDLWVAADALVSSIGFKQVRDASTPAARTLLLLLPSLGKKTEDGRDGEDACNLVTELPAAFSAERDDISE